MDYEYNRLMVAKQGHSNMGNLSYTKLEMQNHLKLENINAIEARTLFRYRTRMANYGENVRGQAGPVSCPLVDSILTARSWLTITVKKSIKRFHWMEIIWIFFKMLFLITW